MRIIKSLFVILTLQVFPIFAQDDIAISRFTLNYDNNVANLLIEYSVNYSGTVIKKDTAKTKNVFEKFFGGTTYTEEKKALTVSEIKTELIHIVSNNQNLNLEPKFPKDIIQIIDLIKGKRKKEKARKIYIEGNPEKTMNSSEKVTMNTLDGYYKKTITISYWWSFRVDKKTSLNVPSFPLLIDDKIFQTKPMTIIL